jgi:hypothetical protein
MWFSFLLLYASVIMCCIFSAAQNDFGTRVCIITGCVVEEAGVAERQYCLRLIARYPQFLELTAGFGAQEV